MAQITAGSSGRKDDHNKVQKRQGRRWKRRPPHKFTQNELEILKRSFEENPYPTLTTKRELANELHCRLYVINNWFKSKRYKLPPAEKKRIFAIKKLNKFHGESSQFLVSPSSQPQSDNSYMRQTAPQDQKTLLYTAGYSTLETQTIPSGHVDSGDSVITGINKEPRCPPEYKGDPTSGPSLTYTPGKFFYTSVQYFESVRYEAEESCHSLPILSHYVFTGQGTAQQQEEGKDHYQHMSFQGQQPNPWRYHLQELSQPQYYQENYQLPCHNQFFPCQHPSGLGQQEPKLSAEEESNECTLSSLLQQAPAHIADRSPPPPEQGMLSFCRAFEDLQIKKMMITKHEKDNLGGRFTQDQLEIRKQIFEKDPYPNSTTKAKLAHEFDCQYDVIDVADWSGKDFENVNLHIKKGDANHGKTSRKKDDRSKAQEKKCGMRKTRLPHRFTKDESEILKRSFQENPYPTFTTKKELASELHCQLYVIENWFQDRRYRLPPAEKKRIFAIKKLNGFPIQRSQSLLSPNSQAQSDHSSKQQTALYAQETLLHRAGYNSLETHTIPSGHISTGYSLVTGIHEKPRSSLEYQRTAASEHSSTYTPANFFYPNTPGQYFESARYEPEKSHHSLPFPSHYVFPGQETGQQQEEHKTYYQYLSLQGQQPNPWGCHLQRLSQPQCYQEKYQWPFQDQFLACQDPRNLGQQEPPLALEQESNECALSSLPQQAPVHIADRCPPPLGQVMEQVYEGDSSFEVQYLENSVHWCNHQCGCK
ncbi:PREDICTED: uncharacterized protein LOC106149084 [Chinchilla lanigera]|uniref:uncharacterized protein LOC106149084 n=1 Tax=Chinchilla lanigera TaxID=34839 RepID=UPI000698AAF0|nr:PREDICTED: uncharacterized protein LOC106149084 [Chinchilla lanigera]